MIDGHPVWVLMRRAIEWDEYDQESAQVIAVYGSEKAANAAWKRRAYSSDYDVQEVPFDASTG